jgi:hypothetical protein
MRRREFIALVGDIIQVYSLGKNGPGSGELCQPTRPPVLVTTSSAVCSGEKA